ncbi:MAG: rod shape-determining protein MreC [Balneolaceae bacterium]
MRRVTDVKDYILTAFILLIAITLMVNRHDGGLENARKASITILSYLEKPLSNIRIYRQALTTNTYLQRQNVLLQDELSRVRSIEQQNRVLRDLLELQQTERHPVVPVNVVAKELVGLSNYLTLDAGSADDVKVGMPVINSDGLIGQIIITNGNFSQVLPYSNSMFRVSARVEGSRAYGIVSWQSTGNRELVLNHVPQTITIKVGQMVETSGYSNQYPQGIPIGEVTRIEPGDGVDTQVIYLRAYANLFTLSEAFILKFEPDSTIQELQTQQEELF